MKNIIRLFKILDKWKWLFVSAGCLYAFAMMVRMIMPKIIQVAVDNIVAIINGTAQAHHLDIIVRTIYRFYPAPTPSNAFIILAYTGFIYIFLAIIVALTWFWGGKIAADVTEKAIKQLRDSMFRHLQSLPLAAVDKIPTSEMIQRSTGDISTIREFLATQTTEVIRLLAIFFGGLAMMLIVHVPYALISIIMIPLIAITGFYFFRYEGKVWEEHESEQDKLTAIVQENLNGIRVVQAFSKENFEIEKFETQNKIKLSVALKHVDLHKWFWSLSDFVIHVQVFISLMAGAYYTLHQEISLGEFASFFTYSIMVTWPMRQVGRIMTQMGMAKVAMGRMAEILDTPQESSNGNDLLPNFILKGNIVFENVSFKYNIAEEKIALNDVSFEIKAGEKIALVGGTGAGKSSIIALLSRFYEPESGKIFFDEKESTTYNKQQLRSKIGIVHQKPFLFSASIKENIAFTKSDASDDEILLAAKAASVDTFIDTLPEKYDTLVGEKGVNLSGGQKQRIALARTILSNPDILILDDATSAVDTETEYAIQKALKTISKGKTTFIIAHRLTSIQEADRIFIFDKGQLVEMGTHKELLLLDGFYKKIYDIQIAIEEEIASEIL